MVMKLLMNNMYGKTTIRPVETDTIVKDSTCDLNKYVLIVILILIVF